MAEHTESMRVRMPNQHWVDCSCGWVGTVRPSWDEAERDWEKHVRTQRLREADPRIPGTPPLDPDKTFALLLSGYEVVTIIGVLMGAGGALANAGNTEGADVVLDLGVKIIKQTDPKGWADLGGEQ
jgi:hypothetical protein